MANQQFSRSLDLSDRALEAETLLNRYPNLTEAELSTLIRTLTKLPLLDFGLMAADERMGQKLDEFYREHGHELRSPVFGLTWALAFPAALALGLLYWAVA